MSDFDRGAVIGFGAACVIFVCGFFIWTIDATHDVSTGLNQRVCMHVDDIGSKQCATGKELLEWLRTSKR